MHTKSKAKPKRSSTPKSSTEWLEFDNKFRYGMQIWLTKMIVKQLVPGTSDLKYTDVIELFSYQAGQKVSKAVVSLQLPKVVN